jgi:hypothetical protein
LIGTPFNEVSGSLSPDGRWIAYDSDETGREEIYVQTFPPGARKWKVSTNGAGRTIEWRPDSKGLFYSSGGGRILAVDVTVKDGEFNSSTPGLSSKERLSLFPAETIQPSPRMAAFWIWRIRTQRLPVPRLSFSPSTGDPD